jgi:hypothetical protein
MEAGKRLPAGARLWGYDNPFQNPILNKMVMLSEAKNLIILNS